MIIEVDEKSNAEGCRFESEDVIRVNAENAREIQLPFLVINAVMKMMDLPRACSQARLAYTPGIDTGGIDAGV